MTDPLRVTSHQNNPGEPRPAEDSVLRSEDLAAVLERLIAQRPDKTPKDLATEAGISYPTLNAWMRRTRGTSRVQSDTLRALVKTFRSWGVEVEPAEMFAAVGRAVPGGTDEEREARLLRVYRELPVDKQRDVVRYANALHTVSHAP